MSSNRDGIAVPAGTARHLGPVLSRALRGLPDPILLALARGLRAHRDELVPGRLFASPHAGGCAVGVALRELAPDAFDFGRLEYWVWFRRRRGVEPDVARRFPQLLHLQSCFDKAAEATCLASGVPERVAAQEVGLWFADVTEEELQRRRRPHATRSRDRSCGRGTLLRER